MIFPGPVRFQSETACAVRNFGDGHVALNPSMFNRLSDFFVRIFQFDNCIGSGGGV